MDLSRAVKILGSIQQMFTCPCGSDLISAKQLPCSHLRCSECNRGCQHCKGRGSLRRKEPLKERPDVSNLCSKFQQLKSVFNALDDARKEEAKTYEELTTTNLESETIAEQEIISLGGSPNCDVRSGRQSRFEPKSMSKTKSKDQETTPLSLSRRSSQRISQNSHATPPKTGSNHTPIEDVSNSIAKGVKNSSVTSSSKVSQKISQNSFDMTANMPDVEPSSGKSSPEHEYNSVPLDLSLPGKTSRLEKLSVFAHQSSWTPLNLSLKPDTEYINHSTTDRNMYLCGSFRWKPVLTKSNSYSELFPMQLTNSTSPWSSRPLHVSSESLSPVKDNHVSKPTPPTKIVSEPMELCSDTGTNKRKTENTLQSKPKKTKTVSEEWAAACEEDDVFLANCDFGSPARSNSGKHGSPGEVSVDAEKVVVLDENTNNDEEILLQSTPKKPPNPATTIANADGEDSDDSVEFCFQTPDSKVDSQNPRAAKLPFSSPRAQVAKESHQRSPSILRESVAVPGPSKSLDRVRNQLSFGSSPPTKLIPTPATTKTPSKRTDDDTSIPEEFFTDTEFFSFSPGRPVVASPLKNHQARMLETEKRNRSPVAKTSTSQPKSASPYRSPLRTHVSSSPCRKSLVFCPTRFNRSQMVRLEHFSKMFGAKITKNFNDEVTHLILTLEGGRIPQTMKYLLAIAGKKWVVTFSWVEACMQQKRLIPEEAFETSTVVGCDPGVKLSRLATIPLFAGMRFCVIGSFQSSGATSDEWKSLLRKLGAELVKDSENFGSDVIIVGDAMDICTEYHELWHSKGMVTVAWEYILECTIKYELIPLSPAFVVSPLVPWEELCPLLPSYLVDRDE